MLARTFMHSIVLTMLLGAAGRRAAVRHPADHSERAGERERALAIRRIIDRRRYAHRSITAPRLTSYPCPI